MRARAIAYVASVGLVAVIVVPGGLMYHRLHPDRVPLTDDPARHGLRSEDVAFLSPVDGAELHGWYMPSPRPSGRAVVIVPGLDNNRLVSGMALPLASGLLDAGFDVLTFDLRGEGESGGEPITFGAREQWDVLGAVREAKARGDRRVGVIGFSLGAASTILAAARSPEIDAVVADSSFADLTETLRRGLEVQDHLPGPIADYGLLLYRVLSGADPGDVSPERVVGEIAPRPLLVIHGSADDTVPVSESERLAAAAGSSAAKRWLIVGGRHAEGFKVDPAAYTARVTAFFEAAMP